MGMEPGPAPGSEWSKEKWDVLWERRRVDDNARNRPVSRFLIWLLGMRGYLRIPQRVRRRLGLVCGEDMSDLNGMLRDLQRVASKK